MAELAPGHALPCPGTASPGAGQPVPGPRAPSWKATVTSVHHAWHGACCAAATSQEGTRDSAGRGLLGRQEGSDANTGHLTLSCPGET